MTLVLFSTLKIRMNITKTTAMPMCTFLRRRSSFGRSHTSTQKLVVRAVRAESALENDAATMPIVNNTVTTVPRLPVAANIGRSSSPLAGSATPSFPASITSSTPSAINSRLAGTKAKPYVHTSF